MILKGNQRAGGTQLALHSHNITIKSLNHDIAQYLKLSPAKQDAALRRKLEKKHKRRRTKSRTYD